MSDMDYRDARYGFSEEDIAKLQAEQARDEKWTEFRNDIKWFIGTTPFSVLHMLAKAMNDPHIEPEIGSITDLLVSFKEGQEWSDVILALGQARQQWEQERERLLTQG